MENVFFLIDFLLVISYNTGIDKRQAKATRTSSGKGKKP